MRTKLYNDKNGGNVLKYAKNIYQLNLLFIRTKNELIFDLYGVKLVPEDQVIGISEIYNLNVISDSQSSLYCQKYRDSSDYSVPYETQCSICPMNVMGNNCNLPDSTYQLFVIARENASKKTNKDYLDILESLVESFILKNKEFQK